MSPFGFTPFAKVALSVCSHAWTCNPRMTCPCAHVRQHHWSGFRTIHGRSCYKLRIDVFVVVQTDFESELDRMLSAPASLELLMSEDLLQPSNNAQGQSDETV